jgi:hypothetical protein
MARPFAFWFSRPTSALSHRSLNLLGSKSADLVSTTWLAKQPFVPDTSNQYNKFRFAEVSLVSRSAEPRHGHRGNAREVRWSWTDPTYSSADSDRNTSGFGRKATATISFFDPRTFTSWVCNPRLNRFRKIRINEPSEKLTDGKQA